MSQFRWKPSPVVLQRIAYSVAVIIAAVALVPSTRRGPSLHIGLRKVKAAEVLLHPKTLAPRHRPDFWHTEGNRILDSRNHPVRISGVNWSGFETKEAVPGGLESQDYRTILRGIKQSGFNTVRLPFSNAMVESPEIPVHIGFVGANGPINADLEKLDSLQIMDKIITYSAEIGLRIILDNHRSEAGSSAQESGLWYTDAYPEAAWINDWTRLAVRYKNNPAVIGMDLRNEPHNAAKGGSCWDCGGDRDWHRAATRAGNAILAVNPQVLIFVEGVDTYSGDSYWWGGNLEGVSRSPIHLALPNHLVYSAHEYGPTEYAQPWFTAATTPASLAATWRRHWAYVSDAGIAPVWIGEFGTSNDDAGVQDLTPGSEGQWFSSLVQFLAARPALSWAYWGINGEDRYGLLNTSYSSAANAHKASALASIQAAAPVLIKSQEPFPPVTYASVPTSFTPPNLVGNPRRGNLSGQPLSHTESRLHPSAENDSTSVESVIAASTRLAISRANQSLAEEEAEPSR